MDYKLRKLDSGLRLLTSTLPSSESATITVWVKTGSRNEDKKLNGISHFLEHMVFKGSEKRPTAKKISEAVDSFGGEFNAGTSKDWTSFYIKCRTSSLDLAADVLSDMVFRPLLDEKEIEKEKGTIIQELAMYEDTPVAKIHDVFEGLAFSGSSLAWDIGGEAKSVKKIKKNDFLRYRAIHYYPENMLVSMAGGITESEGMKLAKKYFSGVKKSAKSSFKNNVFKNSQKSPCLKLKIKEVEQAHLILGFMGEGRGYPGRFAQSVLSTILAGPMSSRLFLEVRERRGLAYAVKPASDKFKEIGYLGVYAGVDLTKCEEAIKVMLDQIYGLAEGRYPITKEELRKTKEYIKGHIALSLEDSQAVGDFFAEQVLFLDEILKPEEVYKRIESVTIEDIMREAKKLFKPEKLNLALIGPYDRAGDKERFEKLLK